MSPYPLYSTLSAVEMMLSVVALVMLVKGKELRIYWPMLVISTWQTVPFLTWQWLRNNGQSHHIPAPTAYALYFYCFWVFFALQAICSVILTYLALKQALRPLPGLQQLGDIMYLWIAAITLILTLSAAQFTYVKGNLLIVGVVGELQRSAGTAVLSLILFVCIAIRPMGLTWRSRIIGISAGLIFVAATNLFQSAYLVQPRNMYRPYAIVQILTNCCAEVIWIWYFSRPEPKRKFVLLATTSPFHAWNRIAEQFGAEPGYVAIGGVPPDAFAASEIAVFHRASTSQTREDEGKG